MHILHFLNQFIFNLSEVFSYGEVLFEPFCDILLAEIMWLWYDDNKLSLAAGIL